MLLALQLEEDEECSCGQPMELTGRDSMYTWRVHRRTCEACRMLEAEIGNDQEGKSPKRGMKYAVYQETGGG